jgi:hypothetical protein
MTRYILSSFLGILLLASAAYAQVDTVQQAPPSKRDSLEYIVLMKSGDSFRGNLVTYTDSTVTIDTEFGEVTILKKLIDRFIPLDGPYLRRPQHFLMPTGSPQKKGGFVSNYELGFFYGGFGIGGLTIAGGFTTIPGIPLSQQIYHVGAKFTVEENDQFDLALGATYSWITTDHPYSHVYAVTTFTLGIGRYSAMAFYRATGDDFITIEVAPFDAADTTVINMFYQGSLGAAFGFDVPLFGRDDIFALGEIWNNDVQKPGNTVSMLAVRVSNETLSADFGVALFTAPFVVPVVRFSWML